MRRLLYIAFFFEVGFVLVVTPWSGFWDRNYFLQEASLLQAILTNDFVRGGISGLGLVNIFAGFSGLVAQIMARTSPGSIVDER